MNQGWQELPPQRCISPFPIIRPRHDGAGSIPGKSPTCYRVGTFHSDRKCSFVVVPFEAEKFVVVEDFHATPGLRKMRQNALLQYRSVGCVGYTARDIERWRRRSALVGSILGVHELIGGRPSWDFYAAPTWRASVLREMARANGVSARDVRDIYWQGVRYGSDKASLLPVSSQSGCSRPHRGKGA